MKFPLFGGQSNGVNVVDFDQKLLLRHKNIYVSLNARIKLITFEIFVENKCDLCSATSRRMPKVKLCHWRRKS